MRFQTLSTKVSYAIYGPILRTMKIRHGSDSAEIEVNDVDTC